MALVDAIPPLHSERGRPRQRPGLCSRGPRLRPHRLFNGLSGADSESGKTAALLRNNSTRGELSGRCCRGISLLGV